MRAAVRVLIVANVTSIACGSGALPPDFVEARKKWTVAGITNYRFVVEEKHGMVVFPTLTVDVRNGSSHITGLPASAAEQERVFASSGTVERLFSAVEAALRDRTKPVYVIYDAQYGFPTQLRVDHVPSGADDETGFDVREFTILR